MTEELLENANEPVREQPAPTDYAPTAEQGTALCSDAADKSEDISVNSMAFWHFEEEEPADPLPEAPAPEIFAPEKPETPAPALDLSDLLKPSADDEDLFAMFAGTDEPASDPDDAAAPMPEDPPEPQCVSLFDDESKPERRTGMGLKTVLLGIAGILLGFLIASALMLRTDTVPPFLQRFWQSLLSEQSIDRVRDLMNLLIPARM